MEDLIDQTADRIVTIAEQITSQAVDTIMVAVIREVNSSGTNFGDVLYRAQNRSDYDAEALLHKVEQLLR